MDLRQEVLVNCLSEPQQNRLVADSTISNPYILSQQ